jgi:23S rRNA pseudouridine1911/1915/1917 synthase
MDINILFEDQSIIVCEKPVGVPSQSDKTGDFDMVNRLKNYIYEQDPQKRQPYVGIVHRLDRPVGGIMVFAKTSAIAKDLSEQIRKKEIKKKYLTVLSRDLSGALQQEKKILEDYIVKDGKTNLSKISVAQDKNAKKAELYYKVLEVKENLSLVEVELITGRHHQIRVQMTENVAGLWGDTKYNPQFQKEKGWSNIALYAYYLEFDHPKTNKRLIFDLQPKGEPFNHFIA